MNETMNEVMDDETMVTEEPMETMVVDSEGSEGGSGKMLATILAIGAGIATAGTVVYKKLKAKNVAKPGKKFKKKLMWVDVPIDDEGDSDDIVDIDETDVVEEESKTK